MPISPGFADRRARMFDAALELRSSTAAALAASAAEAAIAVPGLSKNDTLIASINYSSYSGYVAGTAEWAIALEVSLTATGTFVEVARMTLNGTAKPLEIALSGLQIENAVSGAQSIRVRAIKTGTPGTLRYGAFLAPSHC